MKDYFSNISGKKIFHWFLVLWGLLNLIQAFFTPLHNDEAYYWMYSQYLAWGYYDHPPMIALMIKAGYFILSNELGVRLFVVLSQVVTLLMIWSMINNNKKESSRNVLLIVMILSVIPLLNIYGFIATPDAPLLFFTALVLLSYRNFIKEQNWLNTIILGITMAGLMYSKYHGALLLILIIISNWKLLKSIRFWVAAVFAIILFTPHIIWQISNGLPSLQYHLEERASGFELSHVPEYIITLFVVHNPYIFFLLIPVMFRIQAENIFKRSLKFIIAGIIIFFFLASFIYHIEAHWTALIIIPMLLLILNTDMVYKKFSYIKWVFFILVPLFLFVKLALMADFLPVSFLKKEFHHYKKWAKEIEMIAGDRPVVFTNSYQDPSEYTFYTGKFAHSLNNKDYRKTQYDLWSFEEKVHGREVLYVPHWLDDYYKEHLSVYVLPEGDTLYCRIFKDFQSLQRKCVIPVQDSWSFISTADNKIDLLIFNPYPYPLNLKHPDFPVIFQAAFFRKDGYLEMKQNLDINLTDPILNPGDTISVSCEFRIDGLPAGEYNFTMCTETGILYDVISSGFRKVSVTE